MGKKYTTESFLEKVSKIYNYRYDYSLVEYTGCYNKIKIICKKHGIFEKSPRNHLVGQGCPYCEGGHFYSKEAFIEKANHVHHNKYNYSLIEFKNMKTKIKIICPIHGVFEQSPHNHTIGKQGCLKCYRDSQKYTKSSFIEKAQKVHNHKYNYSKVIYKGSNTKIEIICPIHGSFFQEAHSHLKGNGCSLCNVSIGENKIKEFLEGHNIKFEQQKRFYDCKYKKPLPFDFYIQSLSLFIEYNGNQHYEHIKYFHPNIENFKKQQLRDNLKKEYAESKGVFLNIRDGEDIEEVLKAKLLPLI